MSEFARTASSGMWAAARRGWWLFLVRGLLALAIGIFALVDPRATLGAVILLLGWFLLIDGAFAAVKAFTIVRTDPTWPLLLLAGIAGIATGIAIFTWPRLTALTLAYVIGLWAVVSGFFEIVVAFALRRAIAGALLYVFFGLVSLVFGGFVLFEPRLGLTYLTLLIAIYGFFAGISLIAVAFRLRRA